MSDIPIKVSVAGEAIYPHLMKPDVRFNEHGEFKVTLKIAKQDASKMVQETEQAIEDSLAKAEKDNKGKKVKSAPKPYKEESGNVFFKFKMKASGVNKKTQEKFTQRPQLLDSKKNPISPSTSIWGGSIMKIAYQPVPYFTPNRSKWSSAKVEVKVHKTPNKYTGSIHFAGKSQSTLSPITGYQYFISIWRASDD